MTNAAISEKHEYWNNIAGELKRGDPLAVHTRVEDLSRQLGRTTVLIDGLPDDGVAIVIVHSHNFISHLKHAIMDLRPDYPIKQTKFISYQSPNFEFYMRGLRVPVFMDHFVGHLITESFLKTMNYTYNRT